MWLNVKFKNPHSEIRLRFAFLIVTFRIVCGNLGIYVRLFPVQTADRVLHMQFDAKHVTSPVTQLKTCNRNMALIMMNSVIPVQNKIKKIKINIVHVRFVFTSSCLWEGSYLIYIICVCLRIVVSNTYCVEFLFCLSSSCVP
jgi:hypothetical protein